jgi:hypothetical protein
MANCNRCGGLGWQCTKHRNRPWKHIGDDGLRCQEPGEACREAGCEMSGGFGPPLPDDGTDPKRTKAYALDRMTKAYIARFGARRFDELCSRAMAEALATDPNPAPVEHLGNGMTQRAVNTMLLFDITEKFMQKELDSPEAPAGWFRGLWTRLTGQ